MDGISLKDKKVLVTGANGHLGAALVRQLISVKVQELHVIVHKQDHSLQGLDVVRKYGSIEDQSFLEDVMKEIDIVFHLAAKISVNGDCGGLVQKINIDCVKNVAQAALKNHVSKFVHVSSIHAFNHLPQNEELTETRDKVASTHNAYDFSKASGEQVIKEMTLKGLPAVIVNPTGVIGPLDYYPSRMGAFFLMLKNKKLWALTSGGFDWVDNRDVSDGIIRAAKFGRVGESYILSGQYLSLKELANKFCTVVNASPPKLVIPIAIARLFVPFAMLAGVIFKKEPLFTLESLQALMGNSKISHQKATRELGYHPRDIEKTLLDIADFIKEE